MSSTSTNTSTTTTTESDPSRRHYRRQRSSLEVLSERIEDVATFQAAAQEISDEIVARGYITTDQCTEIIRRKEKVSDMLLYYFPGAMSGRQVYDKTCAVLKRLGLCRENSLYAQSICPDEINHEVGDLPDLLGRHWAAHTFDLGGLAGIPFTGKTGFGAFKHHVPDNGHALVLMAPHVGLSLDSELGKFSRYGQTHAGAACGAACAAYAHCAAGLHLTDPVDDDSKRIIDDQQQAFLISEIAPRLASIQAAGGSGTSSADDGDDGDDGDDHKHAINNARQTMLVNQTYEIAKDLLDRIVDVDFGGPQSTLVVLTGIQINMPRPFPDFFQPLSFVRHCKDGTVEDLFDEAFPETD